jgi:hypothetical protein
MAASCEAPAGFEEVVDLRAFTPRADGAFGVADTDKPARARTGTVTGTLGTNGTFRGTFACVMCDSPADTANADSAPTLTENRRFRV